MTATISMPTSRPALPRARCHQPMRRAEAARRAARAGTQVGSRRPTRSARAVSEATYRRRRAVVGVTTAAIVAIGLVATHDVLAGSGGVPASAAASQPAHVRPTITAQPGDTLWSIARAHHGEVSLTRYVDTLVDLNGGPTIQVGQRVVLP